MIFFYYTFFIHYINQVILLCFLVIYLSLQTYLLFMTFNMLHINILVLFPVSIV